MRRKTARHPHFKNNGGAGSYVDFDNVHLTVLETPYASWQVSRFGSTTDPDAGFSANPDGDLFPNGIEYHLGLDPKSRDAQPLSGPATRDGKRWFAFSIPLDPAVDHTGLDLLYSYDLTTWTPAANLPDGSVTSVKLPNSWSVEISATNHTSAFSDCVPHLDIRK